MLVEDAHLHVTTAGVSELVSPAASDGPALSEMYTRGHRHNTRSHHLRRVFGRLWERAGTGG
ncbi:MAG TPA: hypothetical protein VF099_01525 [Ktedonobacterales bacterium]